MTALQILTVDLVMSISLLEVNRRVVLYANGKKYVVEVLDLMNNTEQLMYIYDGVASYLDPIEYYKLIPKGGYNTLFNLKRPNAQALFGVPKSDEMLQVARVLIAQYELTGKIEPTDYLTNESAIKD